MDIKVNYKNKKHYKTAKYPIRQPKIITWLIWFLSNILLMFTKKKIDKVNMEWLKPPSMRLSNHLSFVAFEMVSLATYPHRLNNVVTIDGYYMRPWLMELIGAICTRKFTNDMHLIKSIKKVLSRGDVLCMYPEARYSPCGTTAPLPDALGILIKRNKVPVVVAIHRGNHLHSPFWNVRKKRKVPLHLTLTQLLTREDIEKMSIEEINARLREAFVYDDYRYQKDNGIKITEPYRAEGLHKVLYMCPHCKGESTMRSEGAELYCVECGKRWTLCEDGNIKANEGETEFSHAPDWFEWERAEVEAEVREGRYHFEDEVEVFAMPHCYKFRPLGVARLTHDAENGFVLTGHYRGEDYRYQRLPLQNIGLHVEYDFVHIKPFDCVDISTEDDSFFCYPKKNDVLTKLAFATESIYNMQLEKVRKK